MYVCIWSTTFSRPAVLWYMICIVDGLLYVLNGQHGTQTCRAIQNMGPAEGKELEDWQDDCYVYILKYKTPWRIGDKVAGPHPACSQSVTCIPLSEAPDNMLLYVEDQKREKEPQDFEQFKNAVFQAAAHCSFVAPEQLERLGHTVCGGTSHSRSVRGLAHCIYVFPS